MNGSDSYLKYNPFGKLKNVLKGSPLSHPRPPVKKAAVSEDADNPEIEEKVFLEAMQDVNPIARDKRTAKNIKDRPPEKVKNGFETETVAQLKNLLMYGEGFVISETPEYMEGTGRDVHPEFARRLHRGDFSIQAHIDLHGLGVTEAKETFEEFLKGAVTSGKRAVLIIHGRGLSSPGEPILKNKVREWLTRGHWRKWVIAYASAQSCDGGTGATYVLLRHRPISKSSR
ncbi:MAG TPA: Smr/MutS family protein [Syntrophales bacterium]|nr:Smr/MutS family protein [Syntrophales bacterium]